MVRILRSRGRHRFQPALLLAVCAVALLFTACSFLTSDIFPAWLSYSEASVDLRGLFRSYGAVSDPSEFYAEYLQTLGGNAYILVLYPEGSSLWRLLILSPKDMTLITSVESSLFSALLGAGSGGDILCGSQSIDATTFALSSGPTDLGYGYRRWLVRTGAASDQYIVGCDGSSKFSKRKDNASWSSPTSLTDSAIGVSPYPVLDCNLVDAETDVPGTGANFLLSNYDMNPENGYVAYYSATSGIEGVSEILSASATQITGPFPLDDRYAWITSGGPVAFTYGDTGGHRLTRYKLGTGDAWTGTKSTVLDSIAIDTDDLKILSFDPTGSWWFVYDKISGRMSKLRTWWR